LSHVSLDAALEICTARCKEMDAPLAERLAAFADEVQQLAPDFAGVVERMVARLKAAGAGLNAPAVGEEMPPFVLPDQDGRLVSLQSMLEQGSIVIAFHRGHWCPYCQINADALAKIQPEVAAAGGRIVAITPEVGKYNQQLKNDVRAIFPILSDLDCGYALELQLAIKINDEKRMAMIDAGWDISPYQDNSDWILPIPATFVVGQDGLIIGRFVDPDYRKRMDIDQLVAAVRCRRG
jgi:peroxiredoxin